MDKKMGSYILVILIVVVFFGCAAPNVSPRLNAQSELSMEMRPVYQPKSPPGIDNPEAATADLAILLKNRKRPIKIEFGDRYHAQQGPKGLVWQDAWKDLNRGINNDLVEIHFYELQTRRLKALVLKNLPVLKDRFLIYPSISIPYTGFYDSPLPVEIGGDAKYPYEVGVRGWILFKFSRKELADAQRFADDLFYMQQWEKRAQEQQFALFESRAAQWRALKIKPPVSEEQRKYIVQANAANQQKDFSAAIDMYRKALDLDPTSYPEAYFNLALLSAQMKRFNPAITYMKQYLALVPDAADARSAQDKIYEWEFMIQK